MKTLRRILFASAALVLFATAESSAQVYVRTRMVHHRTVTTTRPAQPSPDHVWVEGEWTPRGRTYVENQGRWERAPRPHAVWTAGHWDRRPRGYVWVSGRWN
ncbi:MAG: hypothetical protein JWQ34_3245 [Mucilaginibacter sp.]|uniref:hypothetical protein n=1 Tax=Mucilaginibacter sp. TaxID=1882438 RepID=UPI00260CC27B|nr:hypothetical protein [Mucilaginibacter sp.]MDB5005020.1 hypothetical protein [Mucilaginibacter sp.]